MTHRDTVRRLLKEAGPTYPDGAARCRLVLDECGGVLRRVREAANGGFRSPATRRSKVPRPGPVGAESFARSGRRGQGFSRT
ncbi:hypothetical protein ACIA5G_25890 [Amycolatopsis sp. NPDC051758]|uniref:hypothetical protein n=1 Tax=Amycolatopsis sp. NPDC051758 TaxID=3363935 RepID=UPI00379168AB